MASRRSLLELADLHEKGRISRKTLILAMCRDVSLLVSDVSCSRVERAAMRMALKVARARALGKATREEAYKASEALPDVGTDAGLLAVTLAVADVAYCASLSETSHLNPNVAYYNDCAAKSARSVHNYIHVVLPQVRSSRG